MTELAVQFQSDLNSIQAELLAFDAAHAATPWRVGGWNRKQILGHLIDSAANNRQRFVRASIDGAYAGPGYAQEAWVDAHGYAEMLWETLLRWWQADHEILAAVVARVPADRLEASCTVGDHEPVTLRFLIEDYIAHHKWHLQQIQAPIAAS